MLQVMSTGQLKSMYKILCAQNIKFRLSRNEL
jgi:hypothetical protein